MVPLPSDTITLPLLPRAIAHISSPSLFQPRKLRSNRKHHSTGGLTSTQKIIIAAAAATVLLILILTIAILAWRRRRRAARMAVPPKDAMSTSTSSASVSSFGGGPGGFAPTGAAAEYLQQQQQGPLGPRPLDSHLSPGEGNMQDVPLSAGPKYGYGAQVDGLRVPGMAVKPSQVQFGYHDPSVSHF